MACDQIQMDEYERTIKHEDDHTYEHINLKLAKAVIFTRKQWIIIVTLVLTVSMVTAVMVLTVMFLTINGDSRYKPDELYISTIVDEQISSLTKKLGEIQKKTADISKRVAITSCLSQETTVSENMTMRFPDVRSLSGMIEISKLRFIDTGVYVCEYPGLYLVSVTIISNTYNAEFKLFKNLDFISTGFLYAQTDDASFDYAITSVAALQLDIEDSLKIVAQNSMSTSQYGSCLTIVKLM